MYNFYNKHQVRYFMLRQYLIVDGESGEVLNEYNGEGNVVVDFKSVKEAVADREKTKLCSPNNYFTQYLRFYNIANVLKLFKGNGTCFLALLNMANHASFYDNACRTKQGKKYKIKDLAEDCGVSITSAANYIIKLKALGLIAVAKIEDKNFYVVNPMIFNKRNKCPKEIKKLFDGKMDKLLT